MSDLMREALEAARAALKAAELNQRGLELWQEMESTLAKIDAALREMDEAQPVAEHLRAERNQLREFVAAIFEATDWPHGGDLDAWTFQEMCAAYGILLPETRTEPCMEGCWCDEYHGGADGMKDGVTCYRKPQWLIDAARGARNG